MSNLKKIAIEAGLAEGTVSRILKGSDQCAEKTRERVLAIARKHKYRPNMLVQGMQTGRTKTIGVMLPFVDEFFGHIINGIHDQLVQSDHVPIVLCSNHEYTQGQPGRISTELQQIYRLIDRRVDGIILHPVDDTVSDEYLHEILDRHIPLISVDRELEHAHADFIGTDDEQIGEMAAGELLKLGHTRLGHIAGPDNVTTGRRRRQGFERAVERAGFRCQTMVSDKFDDGTAVIQQMFASASRPTAIFAANDVLASQTYQAADRLGLRIPEDLSIIGCSNLTISRLLSPELSTFEHFPEKIGGEAAKLLLTRLENKHNDNRKPVVPWRTLILPEYIQRASTAPPRRT